MKIWMRLQGVCWGVHPSVLVDPILTVRGDPQPPLLLGAGCGWGAMVDKLEHIRTSKPLISL